MKGMKKKREKEREKKEGGREIRTSEINNKPRYGLGGREATIKTQVSGSCAVRGTQY